MQPLICTSSSSSIRATGMPDLNGRDHRLDGLVDAREAHTAAEIASGTP